MTEQEKAVKIIKSYIAICNSWNEDYVESQTVEELRKSAFNNQWWIPKKAALQACDIAMESHGDLEYWQNVKNAINAF